MLRYESLPEELRARMDAEKVSAVRYSSAADEPNDKVDDAVLLDVASKDTIDQMDGYHQAPAFVWYGFHSKNQSDEDAVRSVKEALGIFE